MTVSGSHARSFWLPLATAGGLAAVAVFSGALNSPVWGQPPNFRGPPLPGAPARPTTPSRPATPPRPLSPSALENSRRFEQKQRESERQRLAEQAQRDRQQKQRKQDLEKPAPPFDPARAPPPVDCFHAYMAATRNASSMEQLLPYLSQSRQNQLRAEQADYDPKAQAAERKWFRSKHPELTEADLDRRFSSPYAQMLRYHKNFVSKVVEVRDVKIKGHTAEITVLTQGGRGIDGQDYSYSKAWVEMVGEGPSWKMKDYTSSAVLFD